jgi:hypothetical protein
MTVAAQGFAGKRGTIWVLLASWLIPLMMTGAYVVLMATSETDVAGKIWEGVGLGFVLFLWFLFRSLTARAALSRAVAVGDAARVLELVADQRGARASVYRAIAHEIRADWAAALRELGSLQPAGSLRVLAMTIRVTAFVELGHIADARRAFEDPALPAARHYSLDLLALLSEARLRLAEGDREGARALFTRVADDVRTGERQRTIAKSYLARSSSGSGAGA